MLKEDNDSDDDDGNEEKVAAPDGGWGWMVVIGCALMHVLLGGNKSSFSVLYLTFGDIFKTDKAVISFIHGARLFAAMTIGGPFSAILMNRFGARRVVIVGGLLMSVGVMISAYPPHLSYLFFSYSLLAGLGGSLVYTPGLVLVGQYFNKRRAIATGIASAGSGLGAFCFPPFIEYLLKKYTYSGAMLMLGAVQLNNVVAGALYRPLERQKRPRKFIKATKEETKELLAMGEQKDVERGHDKEPVKLHELKKIRKESGATIYSSREFGLESGLSDSMVDINQSMSPKLKKKTRKYKKTNEPEGKRTSCFESIKSFCNGKEEKNSKKLIDLDLLKHTGFMLFGIAMGLNVMNYISSQMLIPALAKEKGIDEWRGAFLVSIVGISDVITRFASGFIMDARYIRDIRRHVFNFTMLATGISSFMFPFAHTYETLVLFSVLNGLSCGMMIAQRAVVLADMLGVDKLASSVGLMNLFNGVGAMIGPTVAGLLKDKTGSYNWSYWFCGACSFLASFLFLVDHIRTKTSCRKTKLTEAGDVNS
ncbi:unnamed protein product [Owenia fusiformis]|uniref:Uncharacterized protein n=1 Tax=Owenia fusiformis TaxID=6347 RepID=A0A8J1Y1D5_OWEFU|nr:unnamed protein product [Owenia fusiformis]